MTCLDCGATLTQFTALPLICDCGCVQTSDADGKVRSFTEAEKTRIRAILRKADAA